MSCHARFVIPQLYADARHCPTNFLCSFDAAQNYTGQGLTDRATTKASTINDADIISSLGNLGTNNTAATASQAASSNKVAIIVGCTVGIGMAAVLAVAAVVYVQRRKAAAVSAAGVYPGGDVAAPLTGDGGQPIAEGNEGSVSPRTFYSRKSEASLQS